jgi:8-oxo-dGTP pyrophosphatase MutT (NUDIX family)
MNYDFSKWKRLLEKKGPRDYHFIVKKSPTEINIEVLNAETEDPVEGKPNQYGEDTGIAHMRLQKRDDNEFWEVASVASPKESSGVGKILYLLALEVVRDASDSSGISPDSIATSPSAKYLWNNFLKSHGYVEIEEKDIDTDLEEDDPFKYIWSLNSEWPGVEKKHEVKWTYKRVEGEDPGDDGDPEPEPFDPDVDLDDYLEDIYENTKPPDTDRVSKVVIYNRNGKILLLKRADDRSDWDLPGGHLQQGEDHLQGARRETEEETNLVISDPKYIKTHENTEFFKCECPKGEIKLDPKEHLDFRWINPRELNDYRIRKSLKDAIYAAISLVNEDFQQNVKKNYSKLKFKMIGQGKNKYNIGGKMEKPSYKRSKSAPPGFGGSLEEKNG